MAHKTLLCSLTIIYLCSALLSSDVLAQFELKGAPVNPRFLSNVEHRKLMGDNPYSAGYRPGPITPETHRLTGGHLKAAITDTKYDLRDPDLDLDQSDSLVSPVKDQGACGSCWTFSTYGSLESHLLKTTGTIHDFSEDNMKHRHGFEVGPCEGGNEHMSSAYMARHLGPLSEADDPYDPSETSAYCTTCTPVLYPDNHIFLPARSGYADNQYIKQGLLDYGAIQTTMFYDLDLANYDDVISTYYYSGGQNTNHGVTIVGWDDEKIVTGAPGNGAFIVKNSFGTSMGENGFFYVSYYDSKFAYEWNVAYTDVDDNTLSFDIVYQYDPLGNTYNVGCTEDDGDDWGANIFTPASNGLLTAVGLYLNQSSTAYEIYIYDDFSGSSFSTLLTDQSGSRAYAGYYTIPLDTPVNVTAGNSFSIVVRFNNGGIFDYPIPTERSELTYSVCSASAGESYYSCSGSTFNDLTNIYPSANVCIKAFVNEGYCPEDSDGDGYGDPADPACPYSELDCDDSNPNVNPGAFEICDNLTDDDCNTLIDLDDPSCGECTDAAECNDNDVCTVDNCVDNVCENLYPPDSCNDDNVCTDDSCNPVNGCENTCNATTYNSVCCEDPVCAGDSVCEEPIETPPWGTPVSIINAEYKGSSDIVNYFILLCVPVGAALFWRRLKRKK